LKKFNKPIKCMYYCKRGSKHEANGHPLILGCVLDKNDKDEQKTFVLYYPGKIHLPRSDCHFSLHFFLEGFVLSGSNGIWERYRRFF